VKEQGDYNLKYLVAAALLDDQLGPDQLEAERIQSADAQALLARVEVHPDEGLSARYHTNLVHASRFGPRSTRLCEDAERLRGRPHQSADVGADCREVPMVGGTVLRVNVCGTRSSTLCSSLMRSQFRI